MNLESFLRDYIEQNAYVTEDMAIRADMAGMKMYDEPLVAYADANDGIFDEFVTNPEILQCKCMHPAQWLPGAKTVVSVFFPLTEHVKKSNAADMSMPSDEWLQARYEGQNMIADCTRALVEHIKSMGYRAIAPCIDPRKWLSMGDEDNQSNAAFVPNWSERHAAFAAGLGTFGLSRGLITNKGIAGRFTSVITDWHHEPTKREYTGVYEYCSMCGKCIKNCPAVAISFESGKQHYPCKVFLDKVEQKSAPRYGCGKCQVAVPCQSGIPPRGAE